MTREWVVAIDPRTEAERVLVDLVATTDLRKAPQGVKNRIAAVLKGRQYFDLIAGLVATLNHDDAPTPAQTTRGKVAQLFADELANTDPRFDKARFLRACGV